MTNNDFSAEVAEAFDDLIAANPPANDNPLAGLMNAATLYSTPRKLREWVLDGLLPSRAATMFAADGGVGKSLTAMQIATAVAAGIDLWGLKTVQGKVLAVYCEDDIDELSRRQADIIHSLGIEPEDATDSEMLSLFGQNTLLGSYAKGSVEFTPGPLFTAIRDHAIQRGCKLVILDNVTQMYPGDINNPQMVTHFLQSLNGLALEIGGAVLLLHHIAKSEGSTYAGTAAWRNGVRQAITLTKSEVPANDVLGLAARRRTLQVTKSNYGGDQKISLLWDQGAFVVDTGTTTLSGGNSLAKLEDDFLHYLERLTDQEIATSSKKQASNFAPRLMHEEFGASAGAMSKALDSLLEDDRLHLDAELPWKNEYRRRARGLTLKQEAQSPPATFALDHILKGKLNRRAD